VDTTGRLLTAAQVAERLGYTERYVWKLGRDGVLPRVKLPGRSCVRFAEEDVERLVRDARGVPARKTTIRIVERRLLCSCRPTVQARVAHVERRLGYLEQGWRIADLADFERRLAELREKVVHGQVLPPSRPVTVEAFAGPWFERIAAQVELGRMSPLTYNKYEGDRCRHLQPAFGKLPLGAIDQPLLLQYLRTKIAAGLTEGTAKASLTVLSGMLTDAVSQGHIANNPLRSPTRARPRGGSRHDVLDLNVGRKPAKYLEVSEAYALRDATPELYVGTVLLALTSGLRRNELLGLQLEWLGFGSGRLDLRGQLYWRRAGAGGKREPSIVCCKYRGAR
jgi:excisionase family DNA binding protein